MDMKDIQKEIAGIFADEHERLEKIEENVCRHISTVYDLGYDDGWKAAFNKIREKFVEGKEK